MADWISLEAGSLDVLEEADGVTRYVGPLDFPTAVRSRYAAETGRFLVEFAYPGTEAADQELAYGAFRFVLASRSQRLHRVEVDGARLRESTSALGMVGLEALTDGLKWLSARKPEPGGRRPPRLANYRALQRILDQHGAELLATLLV